jgi:hypothetical protein
VGGRSHHDRNGNKCRTVMFPIDSFSKTTCSFQWGYDLSATVRRGSDLYSIFNHHAQCHRAYSVSRSQESRSSLPKAPVDAPMNDNRQLLSSTFSSLNRSGRPTPSPDNCTQASLAAAGNNAHRPSVFGSRAPLHPMPACGYNRTVVRGARRWFELRCSARLGPNCGKTPRSAGYQKRATTRGPRLNVP